MIAVWEPANGAGPLRAGVALADAGGMTRVGAGRCNGLLRNTGPRTCPTIPLRPPRPRRPGRRRTSGGRGLLWAGAVAGLAFGGHALAPTVKTMLNTVSTDDAYVNGHVTFVAPRVAGQVSRVLVDDNDRVKKGDLLVQLDKEPYQVQVDSRGPPSQSAEADLAAAEAQVRGLVALARAASAGNSRRPSRTSTTRSPRCEPTWRPTRAGRRP